MPLSFNINRIIVKKLLYLKYLVFSKYMNIDFLMFKILLNISHDLLDRYIAN